MSGYERIIKSGDIDFQWVMEMVRGWKEITHLRFSIYASLSAGGIDGQISFQWPATYAARGSRHGHRSTMTLPAFGRRWLLKMEWKASESR